MTKRYMQFNLPITRKDYQRYLRACSNLEVDSDFLLADFIRSVIRTCVIAPPRPSMLEVLVWHNNQVEVCHHVALDDNFDYRGELHNE